MKKFLISFCNNQLNINVNSSIGLISQLVISDEGYHVNDLAMPLSGFEDYIGTTGITYANNRYYIIGQSKHSKLLVLDKNLTLIECVDLYPHKGVHSLVHYKNALYLVVTKRDKVIRCDIANNYKIEEIYSLKTERDTHHLNSICIHNDSLIGSAFGDNEKELWMHAENGYVYDVFSKNILRNGFKQPHSLYIFENKIYLCDSSRKRVVDIDGNIFFQATEGYVRGLYMDEEISLVGHSKGRIKSYTHDKFVGNIADKGILSGCCGISIIKNNNETKFISLEGVAEEIYDIYPII